MLRTEELSKTYIKSDLKIQALNRINLAVEQGEYVALLGSSGSGKTTLLKILGLLDTPSDGRYWFNDRLVSDLQEKDLVHIRKGAIGYILSSRNLIDELNVYENIELPLLYQKISSRTRRKQVDAALNRFGLGVLRRRLPWQLSAYQQQMVALARASATDPLLVIADEPTTLLNSHDSERLMDVLGELHSTGLTVVLATHSPSEADKSNRVIQILDGEIVSENIRQAM